MKYVLFFSALAASVPLGLVASQSRAALKGLVFLMPLPALLFNATSINFFSDEFYRGTARGMEVSLVYVLAFAVLIALAVKGRLARVFADGSSLLYLAYFVWSACSFANADDKLLAWFELWKMIMVFLVYWAVSSWLSFSGDPAPVVASLACFVIANFLPVLRQHFSGVYQVHGAFPHQNSMAVALMPLVPLFFAHYLCGSRSLLRGLSTGAFVLGGAAVVRTYSRGAIAMLPLAAAITGLVCLFRNFSQKMVTRLVPVVFVGLLGVLVLLPRIVDRFLYAPESSKNDRVEYALSARNMIADHPVLGVGLNNWGLKINPPYDYNVRDNSRRVDENGEPYRDGVVETIYLLVAAECGLVGLAILLALLGYHLFLAWRLTGRLALSRWFFLPAGLVGGLVACFLQSTLEWSLKQQMDFIFLMVVFALLNHFNRTSLSPAAAKERGAAR